MTTEAQIEIAMQNSIRSANQFIREAPKLYGVNNQSSQHVTHLFVILCYNQKHLLLF
jgi:hypothetical protein